MLVTKFKNLCLKIHYTCALDLALKSFIKFKTGALKFPGFAFIVGNKNKLKGVITDGDIRRAYAKNINISSSKVSQIMTKDPIVINAKVKHNEISNVVNTLLLKKKRLEAPYIKQIVITNSRNNVVGVIDYNELNNTLISQEKNVCVVGLGFVGLTYAVIAASRGYTVHGVDINNKLIKSLQKCHTDVEEPQLLQILKNSIKQGNIKFSTNIKNFKSNIYIIAVDVPLKKKKPDFTNLKKVITSISKKLKKGDLIILRSTLPLQTISKIVIPLIKRLSKMIINKDWFLSYAPERTIEGDALKELVSLPQILASSSNNAFVKSEHFLSTISPNIIRAKSFEEAELIKLANNSYRDLSFAFSNYISSISENFNMNAFNVINKANLGYARSQIPCPSPGVGGYCLTKDPFLLNISNNKKQKSNFLLESRRINTFANHFPLRILNQFVKKFNIKKNKINILIVGIAFKGIPETNDTRSSASLKLIEALKRKRYKNIHIYDSVLNSKDLKKINKNYSLDLQLAVNKSDVIFIMNNNPKNIEFDINQLKDQRKRLIFDGWFMLDGQSIEKMPNLTYSTMGYVSKS
tara:strand:- start:442 stop:2178 length:1737 start_codon:yes stop_codon:yes gene_type:complete